MAAHLSNWRPNLALNILGAVCCLLLQTVPSPAVPKVGGSNHWAFLPVQSPALPQVQEKGWVRTPVDWFVLSRLEKEQLQPSSAADRSTLIRRLSLDLIGLPPTPEEITAFVGDKRADAYERLVERLLASPHYGERWGQHWLDVAGYADSNGYFDADTDRPYAWRYRDYVIRSLNEDKPFDEFVREQLAGDELAGYAPGGDITSANMDKLIATHFLRNAPDGTGESDGNPLERTVDRYAVLEGNLQILGSAFLGITVQCARCHDHKFEPLSQREYYSLQALLLPAYNPEKWLSPKDRPVSLGTEAERKLNREKWDAYEKQAKALKESQEGLLKPLRKLLLEENLQTVSQDTRTALNKALEKKEKERSDEMKSLLKKHARLVQIETHDLQKRFPELAPAIRASDEALQKLEKNRPSPLSQISFLSEPVGAVPVHRVLVRGNYTKPGDEAPPGVPTFLNGPQFTVQPLPTSSGRRRAFARWLTSPTHPTFARLAVNRLWQHHFGVGIVRTPDNFGVTGAKPTHPELLDYLATELIRSGWSIKAMHRLIVNSATYRQATRMREEAFKSDPGNQFLWRFPVLRLDAEAVRDCILAVTGELDRRAGGRYVPKAKTAEGEYVINETEPGSRRRSIYLQQRRTNPLTLLDVFDSARMNPNCAQRTQSTVALQSLTLLNSGFIRTRSKAFAQRVLKESKDLQVQQAFKLALGRGPSAAEQQAAEGFLHQQTAEYSAKPDALLAVYTDFCQMIFASNGFLYVE